MSVASSNSPGRSQNPNVLFQFLLGGLEDGQHPLVQVVHQGSDQLNGQYRCDGEQSGQEAVLHHILTFVLPDEVAEPPLRSDPADRFRVCHLAQCEDSSQLAERRLDVLVDAVDQGSDQPQRGDGNDGDESGEECILDHILPLIVLDEVLELGHFVILLDLSCVARVNETHPRDPQQCPMSR